VYVVIPGVSATSGTFTLPASLIVGDPNGSAGALHQSLVPNVRFTRGRLRVCLHARPGDVEMPAHGASLPDKTFKECAAVGVDALQAGANIIQYRVFGLFVRQFVDRLFCPAADAQNLAPNWLRPPDLICSCQPSHHVENRPTYHVRG